MVAGDGGLDVAERRRQGAQAVDGEVTGEVHAPPGVIAGAEIGRAFEHLMREAAAQGEAPEPGLPIQAALEIEAGAGTGEVVGRGTQRGQQRDRAEAAAGAQDGLDIIQPRLGAAPGEAGIMIPDTQDIEIEAAQREANAAEEIDLGGDVVALVRALETKLPI